MCVYVSSCSAACYRDRYQSIYECVHKNIMIDENNYKHHVNITLITNAHLTL